MDLRKRLARLDRLAKKPEPPPPAAAGGDPDGVRRILGLTDGDVWQRDDLRPDVPLPPEPVPDLTGILPSGTPAGLRWQDVLMLDTETTGLAGGTGTLVFLIGLAWWDEEGRFHVRQLFLPGPGREAAVLRAVEVAAAGKRVVATYNGASFDLPLLRTRARLNRRDDPVGHLESWDLLVAARRCFGRGLDDCRQQTIEARVCGRVRGEGDIDGALIPATYQMFLHDSQPGDLPQVLRHNRRDMDGLGLVLSAVVEEFLTLSGPLARDGDWLRNWSRALICERRRDNAAAAGWSRAVDPTLAEPRAVCDAVRMLKRVQDWRAVEDLVCIGLGRWPQHEHLHYEAAVLYEHRLGDPARAVPHARALADDHRLARLQSKLSS